MEVFLKPLLPVHASEFHKYASDKLISDTMAEIPHPYPIDEVKKFISEAIKKQEKKQSYFFVIENASQFVGACSIFNIHWEKKEAEINYWVGVPFWQQGYASKAVLLLLGKIQKMGLRSVRARCLARNLASKLILEKAGFHFVTESIGCGQHRSDLVLEYVADFSGNS